MMQETPSLTGDPVKDKGKTMLSSLASCKNMIISYSERRPLIFAFWFVILTTIIVFVAASLLTVPNYAELQKVLYTAGVGLVFTGLAGGLLKKMLDDDAADRLKTREDAEFVANLLDDLKEVHDRVGRARILIAAHRSVKTYGTEMRDLIDACVQLQNVNRALESRAETLEKEKDIKEDIKTMEGYLDGLTREFTKEYKRLSDKQRLAEDNKSSSEQLWDDLQQLPCLKDLLDQPDLPDQPDSSNFKTKFKDMLDKVCKSLREERRRILAVRQQWRKR